MYSQVQKDQNNPSSLPSTLLLLYTQLIVDQEWEMSLLKTDILLKFIDN